MKPIGKSFSSIVLDNTMVKFPGIKIQQQINDHPRKVTEFHYCRSQPKARNKPHIAGLSQNCLSLIGCDYEEVLNDEKTPLILSGSILAEGSQPISHNYCGYQFGVWAGQLGDGRAHTLGNITNSNKLYELQLKGSGLSPFSRHADGNSVVSSAVRQFLASELMAGLNIPTSRAASLVIAEQQVVRDPLYNGIIKKEKAAIVLRIAESFLRFGSFQVCNKNAQMDTGNGLKNRQILKPLADYLLKNFYKNIDEEEGDVYEQMFQKIVLSSAELVAEWQSIGFVHGVLNTDNMSMVNLTIDYGPFGFIDYFSKDYVSNATDQYERYSYRRQPQVIKWNLNKLAQAMDHLIPTSILKSFISENFDKTYNKHYYKKMHNKLGLKESPQSIRVVDNLFQVMHICKSHFTNVFRILSKQGAHEDKINELLSQSLPTQYYLKNVRVFPNLIKVSPETIEQIKSEDPGFNLLFFQEQAERHNLFKQVTEQSCQVRTKRQRELWEVWVNKYLDLKPNLQMSRKQTVHYVLLNDIATKITGELSQVSQNKQRQLLNKVLEVFSKPYSYNEWFEEKFWKNRPIPIKLTCSS